MRKILDFFGGGWKKSGSTQSRIPSMFISAWMSFWLRCTGGYFAEVVSGSSSRARSSQNLSKCWLQFFETATTRRLKWSDTWSQIWSLISRFVLMVTLVKLIFNLVQLTLTLPLIKVSTVPLIKVPTVDYRRITFECTLWWLMLTYFSHCWRVSEFRTLKFCTDAL